MLFLEIFPLLLFKSFVLLGPFFFDERHLCLETFLVRVGLRHEIILCATIVQECFTLFQHLCMTETVIRFLQLLEFVFIDRLVTLGQFF